MLNGFGIHIGSSTDFLKYGLKLETLVSHEQIVRKPFDAFILKHNYNVGQTYFLQTIQYEAPFTNFGANAVEKYFTQDEIVELMELTKKLAA